MEDRKVINGIQQIGVGVRDLHEAWEWYRWFFNMDIEVFDEEAVAKLMTPHTKGKALPRHAVLALNMQGGGGFEIWQQTKYEPMDPTFDVQLGDLGIFLCKIKCRDVKALYERYSGGKIHVLNGLHTDPAGRPTFYMKDPYGNIFQLVEATDWYKNENNATGGTYGAVIGVSDMEASLKLYRDVLGHDEVLFDGEGEFEDIASLPGGKKRFRRVLLRNSEQRTGGFGKLLGNSEIELIQAYDYQGAPIFKNRIWGDLGYIHLCFDVHGMDLLKKECADKGFPFTVDSADSFDMGVAAGRFSYIEDPDGALIEFVETHKIPVIKKLGWYMKLQDRDPLKPLPEWMINTLSWKRKKD